MLQSRVVSEASFTFVSMRVYGCQSSVLSNSMVYISTSFIFQVSYSYFRIFDNDEPVK